MNILKDGLGLTCVATDHQLEITPSFSYITLTMLICNICEISTGSDKLSSLYV
jgi:hypothetical protein